MTTSTMGDLQLLRDLTRRVRSAQLSYFATRNPETLRSARALEAQLDRLLAAPPPLPGFGGSDV